MLTAGTRAELDTLAASDVGMVRIRVRTQPTQKLVVRLTDVPGYGWQSWSPGPLDVAPVTVDERSLDNGLVHVDVAPNGTWSIDGLAGYGRLVRGGDVGDTYNWCPPADDVEIDTPEHVELTVEEAGPLRARVRIASRYRWPSCDGGPLTDVDVATTLELHTGEPFLRVDTAWDNHCRDQQRASVATTSERCCRSRAECLVRRSSSAG